MPLIQLENVNFSYDKNIDVIKNVSLSIFEGEHIAIIGHNGSGKSTLAKLFNGLIKADSGSVKVMGLDCSDKKKVFDVRKKVGVVFQNPDNQLIASIVEDDVAFGPENLGIPPKEIKYILRVPLQKHEKRDFSISFFCLQYSTAAGFSQWEKHRRIFVSFACRLGYDA